jgi:hypothetical protein
VTFALSNMMTFPKNGIFNLPLGFCTCMGSKAFMLQNTSLHLFCDFAV